MKVTAYLFLIYFFIAAFSCSTKKEAEQLSETNSTKPAEPENIEPNLKPKQEPEPDPFEIAMANRETYDQIFELLSRNEIEAARKLINEKNFDINEHEMSPYSVTHCFTTMLYRFSGSQYMYSKVHEENLQAIEFLLQLGVDPNTLSTVTCEEGSSTDVTDTCNPEIGELLIKAGSRYALNGLLECAVNEKNLDRVIELLDREAEPSLALSLACETHNSELFQRLLNDGVNKNDALFWAVWHEDLPMTKTMIGKGARLVRINRIAKSENTELRELVLPVTDAGPYAALRGGEGFCDGNELMYMVLESNYRAVEFILQVGVDPNIYCWENPSTGKLDCKGASALGIAEGKNDLELINLLKQFNARKPKECE
jgi:hypothetical protein